MTRISLTRQVLALLLVAFAATACGKLADNDPRAGDTASEQDATDLTSPDLSESDVSDDTHADDTLEPDSDAVEPDTLEPDSDAVEPDADTADVPPVEVLREVVTRPLFGQMPLENRFLDPLFALDASTWQAFPLFQQREVYLRRAFHTATPLDMPALVVPAGPTNPSGRGLLGTIAFNRGEHDVSLWLGRPVESSSDLTLQGVQVVLLGVGPQGEQVVALGPVSGTAVDLDGVRWTRFAGTVQNFLGWAELYLEDQSSDTLYLGAPVATERVSRPDGVLSARIPPLEVRRGFSEAERRAFQLAVDARRNNPPPRVRLEAQGEKKRATLP